MNTQFNNAASNVLRALLKQKPTQLPDLPKVGGIYLLYDHTEQAKYIGSTGRENGFYDRIYMRHRAGSEHVSHQFSAYYNVGRMWRNRDKAKGCLDSKTSKKLRNKFIEIYCSAAYLEVDLPKLELNTLEFEVIRIAPLKVKSWNGNRCEVRMLEEPIELVDKVIAELKFSKLQIESINRQSGRQSGLNR